MANAGIKYGLTQKIDEKDKKILKTLFQDGRISIADIANKTRLRRDSVARRLKRLQKEQVLTGIVPVINPPALGLPNVAILLLRLRSGNRDKFVSQLIANKFVVHVSKLIGKFDFYCSIVYENTNHLNQIIEETKQYVPNLVDDFELYQVVSDPKFEKMEDLL